MVADFFSIMRANEVIKESMEYGNMDIKLCGALVKQYVAVVSVMDLMLMLIELKMFYFIEVFLIWQKTRTSALFTIYASWRYYFYLIWFQTLEYNIFLELSF